VTSTSARTFTWADIQQLPEDGLRRELIGGQLIVTPAPGGSHQRAALRLCRLLEQACPPAYEVFIAPFDLYLSEDTYFEPDIMVIPRMAKAPARFEGVPLLVVEVLSPSTRSSDTVTKRDAYAHAGIPHYWIVDPDAPGVMALALEGGAYVERGSASGSETLNVTEPFEVEVVPASLVD
jgi:Uma2 family endonuclease